MTGNCVGKEGQCKSTETHTQVQAMHKHVHCTILLTPANIKSDCVVIISCELVALNKADNIVENKDKR